MKKHMLLAAILIMAVFVTMLANASIAQDMGGPVTENGEPVQGDTSGVVVAKADSSSGTDTGDVESGGDQPDTEGEGSETDQTAPSPEAQADKIANTVKTRSTDVYQDVQALEGAVGELKRCRQSDQASISSLQRKLAAKRQELADLGKIKRDIVDIKTKMLTIDDITGKRKLLYNAVMKWTDEKYIDDDALKQKLLNYVTTTELDEKLSHYVTKKSFWWINFRSWIGSIAGGLAFLLAGYAVFFRKRS